MDDRLVAVGEDDVVELEMAVDPADLPVRPARSVMSCSASSTVEILPIAALAACTWPYSSESSCSGWKTSWSIPTAAISVPIWSEPPSISLRAGEEHHRPCATTPRNSIAGKKTDESFCA